MTGRRAPAVRLCRAPATIYRGAAPAAPRSVQRAVRRAPDRPRIARQPELHP